MGQPQGGADRPRPRVGSTRGGRTDPSNELDMRSESEDRI